jgi:hypothetical protein
MLNLSAKEGCKTLVPWIQGWIKGEVECLEPFDRFHLGHDIQGWTQSPGDLLKRPQIGAGIFAWFPPPAGYYSRY